MSYLVIGAHWAQETRRALLCSGLRRSEQRPDLPNPGSHGPARLHVFAGPGPMLEIAAVGASGCALALRATRHRGGSWTKAQISSSSTPKHA